MIFQAHSSKQDQAIFSKKKILALLTGVQFGKSTVGAIRMKIALHTFTAEDDAFIVAAPTYKIMHQSTLPAFLKVMDGIGQYNKVDATFRMHGGGLVYFRTATEPDSIVGITNVRHVWIDEAGKVSLYFWENAVARAAFRDCQIDLTSSPYALNWLYKQFVKPILQDRRSRPDVELIQAASDENPEFPKKSIEDARLTMDPRRFRAMFGGIWEKMAGLVYDCFHDEENVCEPFAFPTGTRFVGGIDWGYTNPFALVVRAITPDEKHYQCYEFYRTTQTLAQKIEAARQAASIFQVKPWYADPSDPASIQAFNEAGLSCIPADNDIKSGINDHYELIKTRRYKVFRGSSPHTIDEYESYHWPEEQLDVSSDRDIKEQTPVKQNEHACFAAGTLVETPSGCVAIENIESGDVVRTPRGFRRVKNAGLTGTRDIVEASFSNGAKLLLTADHPVYQSFGGFSPLDTERYGAIVSAWNFSEKNTSGAVATGSHLAGSANVYTLLSGSIITDQCRKAITSITSTMIDTITTWRTSLCSLHLSTYPGMGTKSLLRNVLRDSKTSFVLENSQRRGTKAKMGDGGTASTGRHQSDCVNQSLISACYARLHFKAKALMPRFVRMLVSLKLDAEAAWMTLTRHARNAQFFSRRTSTLRPEPVRLLAIKPIGPALVYNLTIPEVGCFYANGILVSNCDANRYISRMTRRGSTKKRPMVTDEKKQETQYQRLERLKRKSKESSEKWTA